MFQFLIQFLPIELSSKVSSESASSISWSSSKSACVSQTSDITRHKMNSKQVKRPTVEGRKTFLFLLNVFQVCKSKAQRDRREAWLTNEIVSLPSTCLYGFMLSAKVRNKQHKSNPNIHRYQFVLSGGKFWEIGLQIGKLLSHHSSV